MLKKLRVCRSEPFIKDYFILFRFMEFLLELVVLVESERERENTHSRICKHKEMVNVWRIVKINKRFRAV